MELLLTGYCIQLNRYTYIHIYIYIHTYIYIDKYTYIYICTDKYMGCVSFDGINLPKMLGMNMELSRGPSVFGSPKNGLFKKHVLYLKNWWMIWMITAVGLALGYLFQGIPMDSSWHHGTRYHAISHDAGSPAWYAGELASDDLAPWMSDWIPDWKGQSVRFFGWKIISELATYDFG